MFLGLTNFYRRFIKDFSKIASPFIALLKKDNLAHFQWNPQAEGAFKHLKSAFTSVPILRHFDPSRPTILEADASDHALEAVISQVAEDGTLYPVAFHSRKFLPAEQNYEIYDKEMLAIVEGLEKHRHYFEGLGQKTTIYSDHLNLL
jgi:RNase H-like domain found in reverse transcriptase